ncbi:MAG: PrsW family intramembrane metalloprotease [Bacteroidetes bacterium]|nr:PrsW family intramembrane metalloprotease [Bacteroidota bacterium]MCL6098163.1 PrsW family intramembrane metalloprotease [Bacteroidota bacterium]
MPVYASMLAAILPMIFYLIIIWRMDKYDREPFTAVMIHFFWGSFGAVILALIGTSILNTASSPLTNSNQNSFLQIILFAPLSEEFAKGVFLIYTVNKKDFDNITDGLVYGCAIGLGFGMTENFIYFITYGNSLTSWFYIVIIRSLFSAVMHAIATGTFGAFLGLAKFSSSWVKIVLPLAGLITAMFIHFMWNYSVSFESTYLLGMIFIFLCIQFFFFVFKLSIENEKKIIQRELSEEIELGFIPDAHLNILSGLKRFKSGWIDESIRKQYTKAAVRLAFSKNQLKKAKDYRKTYYESEIEKNRVLIRGILSINLKTE